MSHTDTEFRVSLLRQINNRWFPAKIEVFFDRNAHSMAEETIAGAQRTIEMEMFMIGGEYGERVMQLLDDKARKGICVRLIHREGASIRCGVALKKLGQLLGRSRNRHSSHHYIPAVDHLFATHLKHSPIQRSHFPLSRFGSILSAPLKLAHDKLIIIDRQFAIMGGMNLASAVAENHDLFIRISGPAVSAATALFESDWLLTHPDHTSDRPSVPSPRTNSVDTPDEVRFLTTRPQAQDHVTDVLQLMAAAKERLWLEMFYLTEPTIIRALILAVKRNLDVRIICDPNEFSLGLPMRGAPNLPFVAELAAAGVPVRLFRSAPGSQMHQKSMLIDTDFVYTGATNFTQMSFRANTESSVLIRSRNVTGIFERRFLEDWNSFSTPPDHDIIRRRRLYLGVVRHLSRYI